MFTSVRDADASKAALAAVELCHSIAKHYAIKHNTKESAQEVHFGHAASELAASQTVTTWKPPTGAARNPAPSKARPDGTPITPVVPSAESLDDNSDDEEERKFLWQPESEVFHNYVKTYLTSLEWAPILEKVRYWVENKSCADLRFETNVTDMSNATDTYIQYT